MCFIGYNSDMRIADRDLIVYKWLREDLISPFQDFQYKRGEYYEAKITPSRVNYSRGNIEINAGLHTYLSKDTNNYIIVIPKGTKYWFNKYFNNVVSEKLYFPTKKEAFWLKLFGKRIKT
jgi:hypothetical protein